MIKGLFIALLGLGTVAFANSNHYQALGTMFGAPTINGKSNVTNPQMGEMVLDTSDDTFYGNVDGTSGGWTPLGPAAVSILTASSSTKTPSATAHFHQLTNNSIVLTPGKWRLFGFGAFRNSGSSPVYSSVAVGWFSANGADSASQPSSISSASNLTLLSVMDTTSPFTYVVLGSGATAAHNIPAPEVIVEVTANTTVYLVSYSDLTTASNARINVYANAVRLQ